jgi:hypothetical protein
MATEDLCINNLRELETLMRRSPTLEAKARLFLAGIHLVKNLPGDERDRLNIILFLLAAFADSTGPQHGREVAAWVADVIGEIDDLNDGAVSVTFAPTHVGRGRAPEASKIWCGRALIASGIDLLMTLNIPRRNIEKTLKGKAYNELKVFAMVRGQPRSNDRPMSTD